MQKLFELTVSQGETNALGEPKRLFTKHFYEEKVGGIVGALRGSADALYVSLGSSPSDQTEEHPKRESLSQETMRKIILRLIRVGEGLPSRRRVYQRSGSREDFWSELDYPNDEEDKLVAIVLKKLEDTQLIVRGRDAGNGQDYVELAHDALIQNWPTCLQWIKDFGQENLVLQRQLWEAALENQKSEGGQSSGERARSSDYQASEKGDSTLTQTSTLWDNSPKLLQVLYLLFDPECKISRADNREIRRLTAALLEERLFGGDLEQAKEVLTNWFIEHRVLDEKTAGELDDSYFRTPLRMIPFLLFKGHHWLNQLEADFVWNSWKARYDRIEQLRNRERTNA